MINFTDGPAAGTNLSLKRAPLLLRVVFSKRGTVDALDQLDDEPRADERVIVYRATEKPSRFHLFARGKGGKAITGWWASCGSRVITEAERERMARSAIRNFQRPEVWEKRASTARGKSCSPETRAKISAANSGRKPTAECIAAAISARRLLAAAKKEGER